MDSGHVGALLDADAEFFTMTDTAPLDEFFSSLTATINTINRMNAPPDPMKGNFTESNVPRIVGMGADSIEILLLTNFVSLTLSFFSSQCFSNISILWYVKWTSF